MAGSLFVVATPIGNLEDLTFRALRTLKAADVVAAEDTRRTAKLLAHYEIRRPLVSLHEHNEYREAGRLVERIRMGESIALVSDAGTPAISDPGSLLVRLCREASLPVVAIPGPSAVTAALSVTGLPAVPFTFMGFPPAGGSERRRWFEQAAGAPGTVVLFEAPHRVRKTLIDVATFADRPIFVHREISKIHEEFVIYQKQGDCELPRLVERGEFVIVLGPATDESRGEIGDEQLVELVDQLGGVEWLTTPQVMAAASAATGLQASKIRSRVKKARIWVKRQIAGKP